METVETNPIYQFLKDNNLTTKDEKSFLDEYSNPQKANELYNFFKENELTTKDSKSFYDLYLKKKGDTTSASKDGGTPGDSEAQFTEENAKTLIPEDGKYKEIEGKEVEYEKTEPSIAGGMPVPTKKLPKQEDIVSKTLQEETKKFAQPELTKQVAGEMPSMVVNPKQLKEAAYPKNNFENVDQNTINETVRKSLVDLGTSSDIFRKSNPESAENINAYKKTLKIQGLSDEQINNAFDAVKDLDTERINVSAEEFEKTPPEGYFQGFFTSFNKAFSDKVLGNLDKASKFLSDITGLDYGGNFAKAKNVFDKYFVEGQTQLPKGTIPSAIIENLTNLAPDLVYTAFLPEMKLAALSNLTKGTITSVPKFSVVLGAENFLNEYDNTKGPIPLKIAAGMRGGLEGAKEGFVLEMLGYSHQKITKSLLPKFGDVGSKVLGTTANAGIFGTYDAANQLVQTGKIDDKQIAASMALAGVFGVPDIAGSLYNKAVSNFMTTPNDVLYKQYAQGLKVDLKTLRRQAEKKMSSDDAADKVAGQALNNMADNIAISNNVLYNPAPYIKQINDQVRSGQLTKEEGDFYISKINQFVAEADPRMEGIKPMSEKIKEVDMQIAAIEQNQFLPIEVKEAQSKALKEQKIDLQNQISNKLSQANKLPSKYATYTVDGEQLTREELAEKLSDSKFIENAKAGNIKINVSNDAEMYDNVIKAFSQEKTEQKTPEPSISGGPEEPSPTMEWSGEAVEFKPKAEEAKPTVLVSDIEAKKADIERRRQEELKERVIYDRKPTVEDGEFRIVGDPNKSVYRINENTGRLQVKDRETGLWTVEGTHGKIELETAQRSGFEKLKENIKAKYDAELNALKGKPAEEVVAERKVEAPKEEVKAEVQLEKPKVVISGTKNGFEILSEKNTEASEFVPSDARGKEADYDAEGFKTETDKDGNTVLNYKIKGNDAFGRRGYMQATVVLPKGLEPNKELVKQTVDQKIVELKEKRGISKYGDVDLNKLTKEDFSEISDAITESLTKPKVEEAKPAEAPAEKPSEALKDVESTAKALEEVDTKKLGVVDYNAKRLSLEEREKEDKPIIKDNTPIGTLAKNDMGDAYELQVVDLKNLTPKETGQNLDLVEKYVNWKKQGNDFPPITAIRKADGTLIIVDGHNRYRAAKLNGDKTIKVWVGLNEGNAPKSINTAISEAYHADKATGKETELTKAVEDLLGEKPAEAAPKEKKEGAEKISSEIESESINKANDNIEFNPSGYYELLDEDGYPSVAYTDSETGHTEFETSNKPQISASKNIGGAITGLFSMLRNNKVNPRQKIAIYEISEKPSIEIPSDARVADFPFINEVRYDTKVNGKKVKEINLSESEIEFLNDFYDSFEMDSDQYDNLLKKYNAKDNIELDNIFKDKISNLIKSEKGKYYRAVIVNEAKALGEKPAEATKEEKAKQQKYTSEELATKSDAEIENRMAEVENVFPYEEFDFLEKEMEKRERESVFNVPLNEAGKAIDALMQKEKEMPNGYGSFVTKKDAAETKRVINRYLDAEKLTDEEVKSDFINALRKNPTTWYADGMRLRESVKEANKRGIDIQSMLNEASQIYIDAGYDAATSKSVIAGMIEKILKGATEIVEPANVPKIEAPEVKAEVPAIKPKEGDRVELPPANKYATANRVMEFKDGEWQLKIGREYTKVSEKFQQDAAAKWNEQNKPAVEVKEEVKAEVPKMEGQDVPQAKFEGETFVPDNEILSNFTEVDGLSKKLEESTNSVRKNKVQQEISEKMQKMTEMQKFVEQNADDIIETLKNKDILKSPCK